MMNENGKIELTELEKARIQGRIDAFSLVTALTEKEARNFMLEFDETCKKAPDGNGIGRMMIQIFLKILESKIETAMKEAGDKLAIEIVTQVTSPGMASSNIRVDATKFRETMSNFSCTPFTIPEKRR